MPVSCLLFSWGHRKMLSLVFLSWTKGWRKSHFSVLPVGSDLTYKRRSSKLLRIIWEILGGSLSFFVPPNFYFPSFLLSWLCTPLSPQFPFPSGSVQILKTSHYTLPFSSSFKVRGLEKRQIHYVTNIVWICLSGVFFSPGAAWAFWGEEERMVEDRDVSGETIYQALNSEGRRDCLVCYKLALVTPVLLRILLTSSRLRLEAFR